MKRQMPWRTFFLLVLLALSIQGCLGIGNTSNQQNFQQVSTGNGQIGVNTGSQALFKGKIYFTQGRNLYVLDGRDNIRQLTQGADVRDPAVDPAGKWVACVVRSKNYANLDYVSTNGGPLHTLIGGSGHFYTNDGGFVQNDNYWFAQPAWSADGASLLFLSDFQKNFDWARLGGDFASAPFLDMQVFSLSLPHSPLSGAEARAAAQIVAYADFGDGGNRDPLYRPKDPNQVVYTHYTYDKSGTHQIIQIYLQDATAIAHTSGKYRPGVEGSGLDPAVALTPPAQENLQPAFAPDGNSLAYVRRLDANAMGLYIMQVPEGVINDPNNPVVEKRALLPYSKAALLVSGQFVSQPVWSPDGKQIAYLSYSNQTFDIWLANVSIDARTGVYSIQGSPVQLTKAQNGIDADSRPFWTA